MITCPLCKYENLDGTLLCSRCSTLLPTAQEESTRKVSQAEVPSRAKPIQAHEIDPLPRHALALTVAGREQPLIVEIAPQAILGRLAPDAQNQTRVDLSAYDALEKGVSRAHLIIRASESGFLAEDLGSSNGSRLNGISLTPYLPTPLQSGDQLMLGKLEIEIVYRQVE